MDPTGEQQIRPVTGEEVEMISKEQLEDIIQERKDEVAAKAHERRRHDLEVIAERKFGNEQDRPLETLPQEMWVHVLSKVDSPKDLSSVWETNPLFRDLLEGKRFQSILFPQVLSLDLERFTWGPLSSFRSVSKSLKDAVDRWHEDNILSSLRNGGLGGGQVPTYSVRFLENEGSLAKILKQFCHGPLELRAKQFFLRSFEFNSGFSFDWRFGARMDTLTQRFTEFSRRTMALLRVIGDQIWRFSFDIHELKRFERNGIPLLQIYLLLKQMVSLMPNLKWLVIRFGFLRSSSDECQEIQEFAESMGSFPILDKLERVGFYFKGGCGRRLEILMAVLRANPHVKTLEFDASCIDDDATQRILFQRLFHCINSVPLQLTGFHLHWFLAVPLEAIQPLVNPNHALRSLVFSFDNALHDTIQEAFHFVNNFPTLECLYIGVHNIQVGGIVPPLNLPQLRKFDLRCFDGIIDYTIPTNVAFFYSLQFLLKSKRLETIRLVNWFTDIYLQHFLLDYQYPGGMIDFKGGHWNLSNSDVWKVFPELKLVTVISEFQKQTCIWSNLQMVGHKKNFTCARSTESFANQKLLKNVLRINPIKRV